MQTRIFLLIVFLTAGCGGGDKHFPSSNPPEYDPKKAYTSPTAPLATSPRPAMKPAEPELQGATIPVPCEKPSIKQSDLEEPPIVCGGGSGGSGGSGGPEVGEEDSKEDEDQRMRLRSIRPMCWSFNR